MTQQEFVKKEVDKELNGFPNGLVNLPQIGLAFSDGLTKGLEIAKEFAEWIGFNYNCASDGWYFMFGDDAKTYTTTELLTIFLTEKYGK